jgi:hypothetical protein
MFALRATTASRPMIMQSFSVMGNYHCICLFVCLFVVRSHFCSCNLPTHLACYDMELVLLIFANMFSVFRLLNNYL